MRTSNPQGILWQLYTNAVFRREFIFDKQLFYDKYNVSPDIVYFLDGVSMNEVLFCAEELLRKRMLKVKNLLPLTFKLIGKDITGVFYKFCDQCSPKGVERHREDAIQFIQYLLRHKFFSADRYGSLYIRAVMLYECQALSQSAIRVEQPVSSYNIITGTSTLSRKKSHVSSLQKFRIISNHENWMIDRTRKHRKRKGTPTPFL